MEVPVDVALAFQLMLMKDFFKNSDGTPFEFTHNNILEWNTKYGEAFRVFCNTHPQIARHINAGNITVDEGSDESHDEERQILFYNMPNKQDAEEKITPEEMDELVAYLKANPAEEIIETLH